MDINNANFQDLKLLEEGLWRPEIRFDRKKMEQILAPDFFEFGRSSRVYQRAETVEFSHLPIRATLPSVDFTVRLLSSRRHTSVTCSMTGGEERALRSSIWSRTPFWLAA